MDFMKQVRELGKSLQQTEEFLNFAKATQANDKNEALQDKIGKFNLTKLSIDKELDSEQKDEERLKELNMELREIYGEIMSDETMVNYQESKKALDKLISDAYSLLIMCADGADPETVELDNCTGNCSSCGGCH